MILIDDCHFFSCPVFMDFFFEVFIEFVTILFLFFMFWFFGHKECGFSAPQKRTEPAPPTLGGEVLTPELPGNFLGFIF